MIHAPARAASATRGTRAFAIFLAAAAAAAPAHAVKPCEELKAEIAAMLEEKHVTGYTLDIVAADAPVTDGKVVGTCDGGTKKIVYIRK